MLTKKTKTKKLKTILLINCEPFSSDLQWAHHSKQVTAKVLGQLKRSYLLTQSFLFEASVFFEPIFLQIMKDSKLGYLAQVYGKGKILVFFILI